ncbi:hypothetical protein ACROYT_G039709 [Oculina patagonica]
MEISDFKSLATVEGAENYQEAAIILEGPPIEIFAQRAAPTVALKPLRQTQGKFYFECKTNTGGYMQLGWADESFRAIADEGKGCGDDEHSWAFDGMRRLKWHNNVKEQYGRQWKAGDVICIAVNLEEKEVSFGLNGDWEGEMGCAFSGVTFEGAVYPCMSLMRGERVQINLGTKTNPFIYPPPEGFLPLTVTHPVETSETEYNRFSSFAHVIQMGLAENSFTVSFPGEMMVKMMGRGLEYEGKKNALIHAGYEATLKKWEETKHKIEDNLGRAGLTQDEIFAVICYTLEKPPVYRHFNGDTRKGYTGDGMDFPILSYLLREACRKILAATPKENRTRIVYRGVTVKFAAEPGQIVRFGSYTSTTGNIAVAEDFQKNPTGSQFVIVTKIGASIKMLSAFPEEDEVLLPPYEVYRVHRIEEEPSRIYLASCFDESFVDKYVVDGNAVGEAEALVKKLTE